MNLEDMDRLTGRYDEDRSWPYFRTLEAAAPAESEDDQIEIEDEGPDLSWVGPLATSLLALVIGIGVGVWVVPIVRSPPQPPLAANVGPPPTDPVAMADATARPHPLPARRAPPSSTPRQSAVGAAAAPSSRKVAPPQLTEADRRAEPRARQAAETPAPPPSPGARLPALWPPDVNVALVSPRPLRPPQIMLSEPSAPIPVAAAASPPSKREVRSPTWLRKPTPQEMAKVYEANALRRDLSGSATLSCTVAASGSVGGCRVQSETPGGAGFGHMALELSRSFKIKPEIVDGEAVDGGTVSIPVRFAGTPWRY